MTERQSLLLPSLSAFSLMVGRRLSSADNVRRGAATRLNLDCPKISLSWIEPMILAPFHGAGLERHSVVVADINGAPWSWNRTAVMMGKRWLCQQKGLGIRSERKVIAV